MKIVTYNLRCVYRGDGVNSFVHRAGMILDTIEEKAPDIICFQEATVKNIGFLRKYLAPKYTVLFTQREEDLTGEGLAVAYRQDSCALYGLEVFWLSPTPSLIASKFPGQSQHSRICQRLLFKDEATGNTFLLYNLHLEEISEDVRVQQMELVLNRSASETVPTLLLGDLNTTPGGKVIPFCKASGLVDLTSDIPFSFHRFGQEGVRIKLDYVLADAATATKVSNVEAWEDCLSGIFLSDHYPIAFTLEL